MSDSTREFVDGWIESLDQEFLADEVAYVTGDEVDLVDMGLFDELLLKDRDSVVDEIDEVLHDAVWRIVRRYAFEKDL